jgi:hypothetical protein
LKQISPLLLQIDLDRSLRARPDGCAENDQHRSEDPHIAFKPARCAKVARGNFNF